MKKYTAKEVMNFPAYTDYNPLLSKHKDDRMGYYWKYFHKYHDNTNCKLTVENADNEWGVIFVITAYFKNSNSASKFHSFDKYMIYDNDEPREFIPVKCNKVVGKKAQHWLENNYGKLGKKRKTVKRNPR